jgi:hypothetical protein
VFHLSFLANVGVQFANQSTSMAAGCNPQQFLVW